MGMAKQQSLEDRISQIEKRNLAVEKDKAWETSWTRRLLITSITYLVVAAYFGLVIGINPWTNALVPALGYLLSTLTIANIKSKWLSHHRHEK